ncbi:anti-sigma regulatory factor (Ser/Thr protein kinase) [Phycicoccus badiiscoriae]|uniref:Anti-sigma regulatory factor (Ser/Thr protein kinase) n=1 Tax=Pedococcus badiiscoriae TaxID=642776 RepID=A0A852WIB7_9MICO|nr:anti-sigma regulatory factor (Ser/Thr protein kinase) [Pedococcus badiiscoriae]
MRLTHDGYRHEAFFWSGDDQFLAGTVPFVTQALDAGQPVMVAVVPSHLELLRVALGDQADEVEFVDMVRLGANPARIIPAWQRFTDAHAGQPVRGIGEPIWHGRRLAELAECQMHEALLNMAVATDVPLWLMCPYDLGTLPADVVAEAHRSHPVVVDIERHRGSTTYGGADYVTTMFETELPDVEVVVSHREFGDGDLAVVRADIRACASSVGLTQERTDDLTLAVHEVALNSAVYGRGSSELRVWEEDGALVCEVRGHGQITDPMIGRRQPPWAEQHGRGLWMANQLCDLVQVRSGEGGTTVRIHTWL